MRWPLSVGMARRAWSSSKSDGATYLGLVCLRPNGRDLCVDAECHIVSTSRKDGHMSTISPESHVASLVLEQPSRARVFERYGIDYCCEGGKPLETACAERGLDVGDVIRALNEPRADEAEDVDWTAASVAGLVEHIVGHHHAYLREELPPLGALVDKVARAHDDTHPELTDVRETFGAIAAELERHMAKEEQVLFPAFVALESSAAEHSVLESVESQVVAARHDHDEVAAGLARLRALTGAYEPPHDVCNSYRAMLDRLRTLDADTHRHVHEENNLLFPRALESARRVGRTP